VGRVRLDQRVVDLGLETTRSRARARILAGDVRLGDRVMDKPGTLVQDDAALELRERPRFVSRGGEKLAGALDAFELDPSGLRCADVGASTGGFTDCLLQRGAASVLAIDVGYGQLAHSLRNDSRVRVCERTNIRHFSLEPDTPRCDFVTADVSFIALRTVLPQLVELLRPGGTLVVLVKPQFELERADVGAGGVVRDPALRKEAARRVREAAEERGLVAHGEVESTLAGPKGNRERFLWLQLPSGPDDQPLG
jgi:23S rRNA (cytidine1920-2'-O)/16S rRNA (cytidine1409-2'-O)-methyltransferase